VGDESHHDMRPAAVGDLLDTSTDTVTMRQLAWHAQVETTKQYLAGEVGDCESRSADRALNRDARCEPWQAGKPMWSKFHFS